MKNSDPNLPHTKFCSILLYGGFSSSNPSRFVAENQNSDSILTPYFRWRHISNLQPTPNIQPNLRPPLNRQARMPTLRIPRPIRPHILPIDRIPRRRFENNPLPQSRFQILILTLDKLAPLLPRRPLKSWKMRPPTRAIGLEINHERTHAARAFDGCAPVVVIRVVPTSCVALGPQLFDKDEGFPALEGAGALFNAFDGLVPWRRGFLRVADGCVESFLALVEDCGGFEEGCAVCL